MRFGGKLVFNLAFISICVACASRPVLAQNLNIPMPTRAVMVGERLDGGLVSLKPADKKTIFTSTVKTLDELGGMVASKPLKAGAPISTLHIKPATAVNNGDLIQLVYNKPGLKLTTHGKALADGQVGETVKVLNTATRTAVLATITAAGVAEIK